MVLIPLVLVLKQPDLGTALMLLLTSSLIVVMAGIHLRSVVAVLLSAAVVASLVLFVPPVRSKIWGSLKPYQQNRIKAFIDNTFTTSLPGVGGGTGMSPWRMMEEWGIPSLYLHAAAYEFCKELSDRGERVPDIAFAGGFSSEDGVFKALALGSPFTKAICMGRA
jgi:hypothetical protein